MNDFNLSLIKKIRINQFKQNIFWNYLSLIFLGISGIVINIIISINYSASTLGSFNQVLATYIFFAMIGSGGINYSILREIQSNINNQKEIKSIISGSILPTLVISSIVTLIYFILIQPMKVLVDSNSVAIGMRYITPGIFFFSLNKVLIYGVINGFNYMKMFSLSLSLRYILILFNLIVFILNGVEAEKITAIFSIAEFFLFIILFTKISTYISWWQGHLFNKWVLRHIKYGIKSSLGGMLVELNTRVDILMLGIFMNDTTVGIYSFAALFGEGFYQILVVLQNILNPIMARQFSNLQYSKFFKTFNKVRKVTYIAIFILYFLSIIIYPKIIDIFTNKSAFIYSFLPFTILISGITIASGYIPFYNIFSMANKPGFQSIFMIMIFITNIIANAVFIPIMGYYGAALGTSLSYIASIFYFNYLCSKYIGFKLR